MSNASLINTTLDGRYLVLRQLGEGGMGAVFEARHLGTGRRVAVKVITSQLANDEAAMARFEREARAAGAIESKHIAEVLDSGRDPATGIVFLAMELLLGEDVGSLLRRLGPLPPHLALCIVAQACIGLQKAHAARVLHRDIKPANLFLSRHDEEEITLKLLDFGVAKIQSDEGDIQFELTATSSFIGSPIYMSPEQARNMRDVDARADVWSLGVVLYKMLSGRTPYKNDRGLGELIVSICSTHPPPIQVYAPWVPPDVAEIVHRSLRIDRAERFQSMTEMLESVRALLPLGYAIREEMLRPLPEDVFRQFGLLGAPPLSSRAPTAQSTFAPISDRVSTPLTPTPASTASRRPEARTDLPPSSKTGDLTAAPSLRPPLDASVTSASAATPPARRGWVAAAALAVAAAGAGGWTTLNWSRLSSPAPAPILQRSPPASSSASATGTVEIDPERLASFGALPSVITSTQNPLTDDKIQLGRMLFHDARLSKNHDLSCNSCHPLDRYGADGLKVPIGHAHQDGRRNSPSIYNSAGFFALMWDGRFDTLEQQAGAPLLNPAEMAMTTDRLETTLRSIPEYVKSFAKAFPGDPLPANLNNAAKAIAAFERKLFTRGRWDQFLEGNRAALTNEEKAGFNTFVDEGCISCHFGPHVGATMFQKLGLVKSWPDTMDRGRYEITQKPADFMVYRVPSLRNVAATAPYFHDGTISSLEEAIRLMARHQLGKELQDDAIDSIARWLHCLTGEPPRDYIAKPTLPPSGQDTPTPDPM